MNTVRQTTGRPRAITRLRAAWRGFRTAATYADGIHKGLEIGVNSGFHASMAEFNTALVTQGLRPVRLPS
jgi:hypothetical protein